MSIGLLCSAIAPFATDITNIVSVVIQVGFWVTPIFWDPSSLRDTAQVLLKLNPMYYVCTGYRDCFVYGIGIFSHPLQMAYFWGVTIIIWVLGARVYKKSKVHFDDVL